MGIKRTGTWSAKTERSVAERNFLRGTESKNSAGLVFAPGHTPICEAI